MVCLHVSASIFEAAELMVGAGVSAVPVIDGEGRLVGIVSEADLMRRAEIGTTASKSWLSRFLASDAAAAHQFVQSHSRRVAEVMTKEVVTATEDTPLGKLAELMETHGIKRIPIVRDGEVLGIVSRADLLRALLSREPESQADRPSDDELRRAVMAALSKHGWTSSLAHQRVRERGRCPSLGLRAGRERAKGLSRRRRERRGRQARQKSSARRAGLGRDGDVAGGLPWHHRTMRVGSRT